MLSSESEFGSEASLDREEGQTCGHQLLHKDAIKVVGSEAPRLGAESAKAAVFPHQSRPIEHIGA